MSGHIRVIGGEASTNKIGLLEYAKRIINGGYTSIATGLVFTLAGSSGNTLVSATHGLRVDDLIRFTSGSQISREFLVTEIIDANTFRINYWLKDSELPADASTFDHLRFVSQQFGIDGSLPVSVVINAEKAEDSASASGHIGSSTLSVRQDVLATDTSTDGDYQFVKSNAKGELWIKDADALAEQLLQKAYLASLDGKLGSLGQKASAGSAPVVLSTEQEAILTALSAKFGTIGQKASAGSAAIVLSTEQEAILTAISTATSKYLTPVDFLDAGHLTGVTIPKSSSNATSVVATLAANVKKIQTIEDVGAFMAIYSDAARTGLICYLPLAGGEVDVTIAAGTAIYLGAVKDSDIVMGTTELMINFLG